MKNKLIIVNLSGRGDKDVAQVAGTVETKLQPHAKAAKIAKESFFKPLRPLCPLREIGCGCSWIEFAPKIGN